MTTKDPRCTLDPYHCPCEACAIYRETPRPNGERWVAKAILMRAQARKHIARLRKESDARIGGGR